MPIHCIVQGWRSGQPVQVSYSSIMTEEDDPLTRDGNWLRLTISGDPKAMEQMGPNLGVSIGAVTQAGTTLARHDVGALIDTGSECSCISQRMVPRMEGGLQGLRNILHVYGHVENQPTIRGVVRFQNGVEFVRDFAVLRHLEPYDVLIGRDILKRGRMYLDLGNGNWRLYFPAHGPAGTR
jgi:hypothetical protein